MKRTKFLFAGLLGLIGLGVAIPLTFAASTPTPTASISHFTKCTDTNPPFQAIAVWAVQNNSAYEVATVTVVSATGGLGNFVTIPSSPMLQTSPTTGTAVQGQEVSFEQFFPASEPTGVDMVTIDVSWPDGTTQTLTDSQTLPVSCTVAPPPPVTGPTGPTGNSGTTTTTSPPVATTVPTTTTVAPAPVTTTVPEATTTTTPLVSPPVIPKASTPAPTPTTQPPSVPITCKTTSSGTICPGSG